MIPLYAPEQMRQIDRHLIEEVGIPGIALMENAARGVFSAVQKRFELSNAARVIVLCGPGNNGGDGLAVLRMLKEASISAEGVLFCAADRYQGDAAEEYHRAVNADCLLIDATDMQPNIASDCIVVDALFGTGLARPVSGIAAIWIEAVNQSEAYVIAVDIPSGINGTTGKMQGVAIHADETITFQHLKPGLLLFPGRSCAGNVTVHSIAEEPTVEPCMHWLQQREDIAAQLPPRPLDSHKGKNGRALMFVGSERYTGAALLAAGAALRGGCGLLTVGVPKTVKAAFSALPEAMCLSFGTGGCWDASACREAMDCIGGQQAIAMGCGMGAVADMSLFETTLSSKIPLVLDADALNALSEHHELLTLLHPNVIITPHPGEMARLLDTDIASVTADPAQTALSAAKQFGCIVLLKGAVTCISDGKSVVYNTSGNPGLAKGGSGDTLTGLITAMLAQGLSPQNAACAGAYLLGATADDAYQVLGNRMLLAGDLIDVVQSTITRLR